MIKALIVDDEKKSVEMLRILLDEYNENIHVLDSADSVEAGLKIIRQHSGKFDILFLDVQMPDGNGFSLLSQLDRIDFRVIFTTAYDQYAINAIKFSALDYLLKPISNKELTLALARYEPLKNIDRMSTIMNRLIHNKPFEKLAIPTLTDVNFVDLTQIIYFESDKNYTTIYFTNGQKTVSSRNIGHYEEILNQHGFCRIHNSYIVNAAKVKRYIKGKTGSLELENGVKLDVSPGRKDDLFQLMDLQ